MRRIRRALWAEYRRVLERRSSQRPDATIDPLLPAEDPELWADVSAEHAEGSRVTLEQEEEQFFATIVNVPELRVALERMWPVLTAEELLHDLFGAPALLRLAAADLLDDDERHRLERARSSSVATVGWSNADLALLDEAAMLLGPVPARARRRQAAKLRENARWMIEETIDDITLQTGDLDPEMRRTLLQRLTDVRKRCSWTRTTTATPTVYGHLIVDEAQDCSPMQWRMLARRCPRLDDDRRRSGPGEPARRHPLVGRGARPAAGPPRAAPARTDRELPDADGDHGAGRGGAGRDRSRPRPAAVGAPLGGLAPHRPGRAGRSRPRRGGGPRRASAQRARRGEDRRHRADRAPVGAAERAQRARATST